MMKVVFLLLLVNVFIVASTINIAVAANVSYAIDTLKKEFSKFHPHVKVNITLGSSGKLTAQIKNGAPFDVFMSANMKYPQALYDAKMTITKPKVYAQGSLAIFSKKERDFSHVINMLKSKEIKRIAVANPKTAPYGIATKEALKNAKVYDELESKFIYGESISQTVSYTLTAVDVGLIAKSSLYSSKMKKYKKGLNWSEIDSKLYSPIDQGIVLLSKAKNSSDAKAFYDFILSQDAKKIFISFGYLVK